MKPSTLFVALCLVATVHPTIARHPASKLTPQQSTSPDDSLFYTAYPLIHEYLIRLKERGLLVESTHLSLRSRAPQSRQEVAKTVLLTIDHFDEILDSVYKQSISLRFSDPTTKETQAAARQAAEAVSRRRYFRSNLNTLVVLTRFFSKDLKEIGSSPEAVKIRLDRISSRIANWPVPQPGAAQSPFADVPTSHWAANAVHELRAKGLITGYPDGTFGGEK